MKDKSPLAMIEQMVMVLVFAIAATLCVKMFVLSGELADKYDAVDRAVLEVQNMAETMKACGVEISLQEKNATQIKEESWVVYYDADWNPGTEENAVFFMDISLTEDNQWIWKAEIKMMTKKDILFCAPVAGQKQGEVAAYEKD